MHLNNFRVLLSELLKNYNFGNILQYRLMVDNKLVRFMLTESVEEFTINRAYPVWVEIPNRGQMAFYIRSSKGSKMNVDLHFSNYQIKEYSPYYQQLLVKSVGHTFVDSMQYKTVTAGEKHIEEFWETVDKISMQDGDTLDFLKYKLYVDKTCNILHIMSPIFRLVTDDLVLPLTEIPEGTEIRRICNNYLSSMNVRTLNAVFYANYIIQCRDSFYEIITRKINTLRRNPTARFIHQSRHEVMNRTGGMNFLHLFYQNQYIYSPFSKKDLFRKVLAASVFSNNANNHVFDQTMSYKGRDMVSFKIITPLDFCKILGFDYKLGFNSSAAMLLLGGLLAPITELNITEVDEFKWLPLVGSYVYIVNDGQNVSMSIRRSEGASVRDSVEVYAAMNRVDLIPEGFIGYNANEFRSNIERAAEYVFDKERIVE